ncbi:MAG: type III secretion system stator protein SctL [Acidobacteria bacterium]|nr:type III secretion system stator protein SctL [Acidobacteriota bacterium]
MIEMESEQQMAANVIKSGSNGAGHRGVVKNQTIAARREADEILARAHSEAEAIIENAVKESEEVLEKAYREGLEKALTEFEKHLIEIREIRSNVLNDAERDLLKLSVRIAEKILGKELASNKKAVTDIVATALKHARQREKVTVSVNPSDLGAITAGGEKFSSDERIRILDFVADPSVSVGGCVIETEVGKIDARLETQLRVIENALLSQADGGENV